MAWGKRPPKPDAAAAVVGVDLDSRRAVAVYGPPEEASPRLLPLGDGADAFPLLLDLERRTLAVGAAALPQRRKLPHAVCADFLPHLGQPKLWATHRHRLDAAAAVAHVAERLRPGLQGQPVAVAVPAYLSLHQVTQLTALFEAARWPVLGTVATPLALAATADAGDWQSALVADIDGHALQLAAVVRQGPQARLAAAASLPALGRARWLDRLIDGASHRCIQICRRDPRDSATAEQALLEQIEAALPTTRPVELNVRGAQWYQTLALTPDDLAGMARPLLAAVAPAVRGVLAQAGTPTPDVLWVTANAAELPGLAAALSEPLPQTPARPLPADDTARAAHALARRWLRGDLPRGHLDQMAPVP